MTPAQTVQLYALIARHQFDMQGIVTGVTPAEIARAWQAKFGDRLPRGPMAKLSDARLIRRLPMHRPCAVAGVMRRPWVIA